MIWPHREKIDRASPADERLWRVLPAPLAVLLVLIGATGVVWRYQLRVQRADVRSTTEMMREQLARRIEQTVDDRVRPLRRVRIEHLQGRWNTPEGFATSVATIIQLVREYEMLAWVDEGDVCRASCLGRSAQSSLGPGDTVMNDSSCYGLIAQARSALADSITHTPNANPADGATAIVALPMVRDSDGALRYQGALLAQMRMDRLLQTVLDARFATDFNATVLDEEYRTVTWAGGRADDQWPESSIAAEDVRLLDRTWHLRVLPTAQFCRRFMVPAPTWILGVGGIVSLLASGALLQAMLHRRSDCRRARQHLELIAALNNVSAALTSEESRGMAPLEQLPGAIQKMLGMPVAAILLLENDGQVVREVCTIGINPPPPPRLIPLTQVSGARLCMETAQVQMTSDVLADPGPFNPTRAKAEGLRALMAVPLVVNGRPLGAIILGDHRPRRFTAQDIEMAKLWAAQAAVILAHARLYEELHRQVETNTTLLRELSHRIKNNLAGIAGLLAMDHPELSPDARQWLDRLAARIEIMGRAHDLFSSGAQAVGIAELAGRALSAVRAIKPSGVRLEVDLNDADLGAPGLSTDRAVTLAVVLHELCYNAVVHGAGPSGKVTVRGRRIDHAWLAVDVVDERDDDAVDSGADAALTPSGPWSCGIGLSLVRGLVGRELRGKFVLQSTARGGTIATVEFPVDASTESD